MTRVLTTATMRCFQDNVDPGLSESDAGQWNFWGNTSSLQLFSCTNPTAGIQTWERILFNGSSATLTLTLGGNLAGATYDITNITNFTGINGTSNLHTGTANTNSLTLQAYDVDGAAYTTFITLSAANTPTCDLDDAVTKAGQYIYRVGGTDVSVADGGTGLSTLTAHALYVGNGASAPNAVAVGATGTVLAGSTGADPAFTATPNVTSITFGAETALAHYLEQTSWTPVITGGTVAGAGTYTAQNGYYTRIGNMIFLQAHVEWSAHTGTGDMTITGLPFSCRNSTNYDPEGVVNPEGIPLPGGATSTRAHLTAGGSTVTLAVLRSNNTNDPVQMNATGTIHLSIWYLT